MITDYAFEQYTDPINQAKQRARTVSEHCRQTRCSECSFHTNTCIFFCALPGVPAYWNVNGMTTKQLEGVSNCLAFAEKHNKL